MEKYIIQKDGNKQSLDAEDLLALDKAIRKELYKIGRLTDPLQVSKKWNAEHKEQLAASKRKWTDNNREHLNKYARDYRAKKKQEKAIFEAKLQVVQEEQQLLGRIGDGKQCPICFSHMNRTGYLWDCPKCHKTLDAHEMQVLRQ